MRELERCGACGLTLHAVVGAEERENRAVNIRNRDDKASQTRGEVIPLDEAIQKLRALKHSRNLVNAL